MRRVIALVVAACVLLVCHLGSVQADILKVIPEKSLVAVVTKNADAAEKHFRDMAEKLVGNLPGNSFIELVLRVRNLGVAAIDRKGPMAMALVTPAFDIPGVPVGVVVKVGNYRKFLEEIAGVVGAAAPEVTPDGTDVVNGEHKAVFAAQLGMYAVVADAEYVVRTFKAEAGKNLAVSGIAAIRKTYLLNDLAVYANMDEVIKTFGPQIDAFKQMMLEQMKNQPEGAGPMPPEKVARFIGAEVDALVKIFQQTDAICTGVRFSAEGLRTSSVYQPVPETTLARLMAKLKPARLELLDTLDGPVLSASGWHIEPDLLKDLTEVIEKFLTESGLVENEEGGKGLLESYAKMMEAASGPGAMLWAPPGEGKGLMRFIYLISLKPGANIRDAVKEYTEKSMKFMTTFQAAMPVKFEVKFEQAVETYRDCTIDRIMITFRKNPEAPEPLDPDADPMKMIERLYGPRMVGYLTQARDNLVYSLGWPESDALKKQVDKILDRKAGDFARSAAYRSAVKGLPLSRSSLTVFSISEMAKAMAPRIMGAVAGNAGAPKPGFEIKNPSAVGISLGPDQKGVAIHVNVPIQEMQNIKAIFVDVTSPVRAARSAARSMTISMNNVRQILLASIQYAGDHDDDFPPNFETLLKKGYLWHPKVFIAPDSGDVVRADYPEDPKKATMEQLKLGPQNASYVFVPNLRHDAPAEAIVVYEKKPFRKGGRVVGFNDGHTEFVPEERFRKLLAEQKKKR